MSLRLRLLLSVGLVALVALVVTDVTVYNSLRSFLYGRLDSSLSSSRAALLPVLQNPGGGASDHDGDDDADNQPTGTTSKQSDPDDQPPAMHGASFCQFAATSAAPGLFVEVLGANGAALSGKRCLGTVSPGTEAAPRLTAAQRTPPPGRPDGVGAPFYAPASTATEGPGFWMQVAAVPGARGEVLVLGVPLGNTDSTLDRLLAIELAVSALALAVAVGFGFWLVRAGLRPLEGVRHTAAAIAEGDLSSRVPGENPRTEVGAVAAALNFMLGRIEQAFRRQQQVEDELRASEERLRRFIGDASHELRTPLAAVSAYAELLERQDGEPEVSGRATRGIRQEADRMGHLVEDLLLLARLDEGRPLQRHAVELTGLAVEAVATAQTVGPDWPVRFEADGAVEVVGDHLRLRQVVDNLLANVRAHTPPGTLATVRVGVEGDHALLEVADRGPGISENDAAKAFDRFYRADPSRARSSGGAGLGLAIVASIVSAHHGEVALQPTPGGGVTFAVRLPLLDGASAAGTSDPDKAETSTGADGDGAPESRWTATGGPRARP